MAGAPWEPGSADGGYRPLAEINMTPFVDVVLVLLIIFMVTAPLMMTGVPLQLPKSAAARLTPPVEQIVVSIDGQGRVFLGEEEIPDPALAARLKALAEADSGRAVFVRGDRGLTYGRIMEVMGAVSAAGFAKVTLMARDEPAKTGP